MDQEPARGEALADIAGSASSDEAWRGQSGAPATPDDLTPIEGIGPKINQVLQEAGITTFTQLAETKVSRLQQILSDANIRLANADSWPEQAKLAAAGNWEELKRLQDELDAGVRR
jgi:predicted flap endonuclease-1-like 5' DNA nuclease